MVPTRAEIQIKIQELVGVVKDTSSIKNGIAAWLEEKECPEFETKQILNDLTSYKEYLDILN